MAKILMIDDEEDLCFFLKTTLESISDYEIHTASNGKKGINLAKKIKPDLIVLDLFMPNMSGDEVFACLAEYPQTKDIPVIFLTALVKEDELGGDTVATMAGGHKFIAKPVTAQKLLSVISKELV